VRLLYLLPYFDEERNSFSKLLVPVLEELERRQIPFTVYSSNRSYHGRFAYAHQAKFLPTPRLAFLVFPLNLFLGTLFAWRWRRRHPDGLIHNIGGGNGLYHDVITAHACHAQYLEVKRRYGETGRIWFNPIHMMILFTEWLNYRRQAQVVAVSSFVSEGLRHFHPAMQTHVLTIENASPPRQVQTPVTRQQAFTILFASNNHQHKGLGPLLDVMAKAKEQGLPWKLLIAGYDPFESFWKKQVIARQLETIVEFLGHQRNLAGLMAASDIFCLPSKYESFGMVFLEAAQVGCPSYGSRTGIMETLYRTPKGPSLCEHPVQAEALFAGLRYWAEHPDERKQLGLAMQKASERFSADAMVRETLALYERLSTQDLNLASNALSS
jgi:glycosyltransferase involved in cell wall biosynthesis